MVLDHQINSEIHNGRRKVRGVQNRIERGKEIASKRSRGNGGRQLGSGDGGRAHLRMHLAYFPLSGKGKGIYRKNEEKACSPFRLLSLA